MEALHVPIRDLVLSGSAPGVMWLIPMALALLGACQGGPPEARCPPGWRTPCQITPGGVVLPEAVPPEVARQALRLHEERPPALAALRTLGSSAGPAMRSLLHSSSEEELLGALSWLRGQGVTGDPRPVAALTGHAVPAVRREAASTLRSMGARGEGQALLPLLRDPDVSVRLNALEAVRRLGVGQARPILLELMGDGSEQVALLAGRGAADLGGEAVVPALQVMVGDEGDPHRAFSALWALRRLEAQIPMGTLIRVLEAEDPRVVGEGLKALSLHGETGFARLAEALGDPRPDARRVALDVLTRYDPSRGLRGAQKATSDPDPGVRAAALDALSRLQAPADASTTLQAYIHDLDPGVRSMVVTRLGLLGSPGGSRALASRWEEEDDPDVRGLLLVALGHSRSVTGADALIAVMASGEEPWAARAHHVLTGLAGHDMGEAAAWGEWGRSSAALELLTPESGAAGR